MVELIAEACRRAAETLPKPYHENIADALYEQFGGLQIMRAFHHGTEIISIRGG